VREEEENIMPIKPVPLSQRAQQLLERSADRGFVSLECESCGNSIDLIENPEVLTVLMHLIEHCMFDHLSRTAIVGVSTPTHLVGGYALASSLGLTPQTKNEEEWRKSVHRHPSSQV
jgi:hypothetical protein